MVIRKEKDKSIVHIPFRDKKGNEKKNQTLIYIIIMVKPIKIIKIIITVHRLHLLIPELLIIHRISLTWLTIYYM